MKDKNYSTQEMLSMSPEDLLSYLTTNYIIQIPLAIDSQEQVKKASEEMAKASAYYVFLSPLKLQANMLKRLLKKQKADKDLIDDMLVRETIFESQMAVMKQSYDTISRLFTIRHREQDELRMMGGQA